MPVETIEWEWTGDFDSSKNLEYRPGGRTGDEGEEYGDTDVYDQVEPVATISLRAEGLTTAQFLDLLAKHKTPADVDGSDYTAADCEGVTYTGKIASLRAGRIGGSAYWTAEIRMPNPVIVTP